jgi:hypothetical protein
MGTREQVANPYGNQVTDEQHIDGDFVVFEADVGGWHGLAHSPACRQTALPITLRLGDFFQTAINPEANTDCLLLKG